MVAFYNIKDISPGKPSHSSGHEAYLRAKYKSPGKKTKPIKIIYKKNKHDRPVFSRLEVTFSQLAKLLLLPGLTPSQNLVVDDDNHVVGLAVEHLCYVIEKNEGLNHSFFTLDDPQLNCQMTAHHVTRVSQIPIYFLDKLPQGFYATLVKAEEDGYLTINYESLASILATSYTLEEDDLHKGNFGFYLVEREGIPQAVFFKIDHDLMFVDSIMGFHTRRPFHLLHGAGAFDIAADDLKSLVNLTHSSNSYWPTKFGYVSNPFDNKEYHNYTEIQAFARLANRPEFTRAKWKAFYKHILIPIDLIENSLKQCANEDNAADRAHIALMTQATVARLARLRAVLFSVKEFRDFAAALTPAENQLLLREVVSPENPLYTQVEQSLAEYQNFCQSGDVFEEGDTPLHIAIKLGDYRYEESISMFGKFINVKNRAGKTPLDSALELQGTSSDIRKDARAIMKHLLDNGARKTRRFNRLGISAEIKAYSSPNPYLFCVTQDIAYTDLKDILRDIGEDHRFCLKHKKNVALACIRQFIQEKKYQPGFAAVLSQLRRDVNGESAESDSVSVKYIRQLRSKLWIIRQLRGLYGQTSTQTEINDLVSQSLRQIQPKEPNCFSFFYCSPQEHINEQEQSEDDYAVAGEYAI